MSRFYNNNTRFQELHVVLCVKTAFFHSQQRLKKKVDSNQAENNNPQVDTSAFDFDEPDNTTTQKTSVSSTHSKISVQIDISGGNPQQNQKIQTNVNVSTTVHPGSDQKSGQNSTNIETNTSFECKQEPSDDPQCGGSNKSDSSQNSDILNQAELDDILKTIGDPGEGNISDHLFEQLTRFDQILAETVNKEDSNDNIGTDKMFDMTSASPGLQKPPSAGPSPFSDPTQPSVVFDNNQNINVNPTVQTPPVNQNYRNPQSVSLSETTGPAAETLKQMAAQHQSQRQDVPPGGYPMKTMGPFSATESNSNNYRQNGGYPPNSYDPYMSTSQSSSYMGQQPPQQQHQGMSETRNSQMAYSGQNKNEMTPMAYGGAGNKPISHYPNSQTSHPQSSAPSSLQQLQNQVAHFNQGQGQMEITQTQHMQVSLQSPILLNSEINIKDIWEKNNSLHMIVVLLLNLS